MKHFLSILFILTLSVNAFSQKKRPRISKQKITVTSHKADYIVEAVEDEFIPDTLRLSQGKKYVLLVDVDKYSGKYIVGYSSNYNLEERELNNNFGKENLQVITINRYIYVIFENKQILNISEGNSYQAFAYWSGKIKDNVKVQEGKRLATEFVAEQMGVKKESSYVINTRAYKKEVASLSNKNNITSKSTEVMNSLLNNYKLPYNEIKDEDIFIFQQSSAKVKSIESYIEKKKGSKLLLKSISLNELGNPTTIKYYDRKGKLSSIKEYVYKNGLLIKIMKGDAVTSSINYDDNKMIFSESVGDATETRVIWLENGKLIQKSYTLMNNDTYSDMNFLVEEKNENDCNLFFINNILRLKNCSTKINTFPFINAYTSYQDGELLQFRKTKIEKKGEKTFEKYYSEAENENQKDKYKLWGTFHLNKFNLVDTYNFTKDTNDEVLKIDYTYYE